MQSIIDFYKEQHGTRFLQSSNLVTPWYFTFRSITLREKELARHNNTLAIVNKRLPGACIRSPGSKLLSITMQLHCGGHLGQREGPPDAILEEDHPMTILSKFGSN